MPSRIDALPILRPSSRRTWRSWLHRHHATSSGVWVVYTKRSAGPQPLTYDAAVEEALCYGWIDSLTRSIDLRSYRQLFTPRKARSPWSALNRRRATAMIRSGQMTEAGMDRIRAAKRDGTWTALVKFERLAMPPDLAAALRSNARARAGYEAWAVSLKRALLWWLHSAKRPETRRARLQEVIRAAERGTKPRPMRTTK